MIQSNILLTDVEIPVHDNLIPTSISLNTNSPSNSDILPTYETVDNIPEIAPGSGSVFPDLANLPKIKTLDELLKYLSEVMIRFNSNPQYYLQDDFALLIKTMSNSLIFLYEKDTLAVGSQSASFVGVATLGTNPFGDAINLNNKFPGIYFAQDLGEYPIFNLTVDNNDLYNNILLFIPEIINNEFVQYTKQVYHLNIPQATTNFRYSSNTKKSVWNIQHDLGRFPSAVITDTMGFTYEGTIQHTDTNNLIITFSAPFKGYADLN